MQTLLTPRQVQVLGVDIRDDEGGSDALVLVFGLRVGAVLRFILHFWE